MSETMKYCPRCLGILSDSLFKHAFVCSECKCNWDENLTTSRPIVRGMIDYDLIVHETHREYHIDSDHKAFIAIASIMITIGLGFGLAIYYNQYLPMQELDQLVKTHDCEKLKTFGENHQEFLNQVINDEKLERCT